MIQLPTHDRSTREHNLLSSGWLCKCFALLLVNGFKLGFRGSYPRPKFHDHMLQIKLSRLVFSGVGTVP